jgi:hypothetical protein
LNDDPGGPSARQSERGAYSRSPGLDGIVIVMETRTMPASAVPDAGAAAGSPAEELPGLYREILERVERLEALGARAEANRIRQSATDAYSRAWDASGRKALVSLLARADRAIDGDPTPRSWVLRRRSAPAR